MYTFFSRTLTAFALLSVLASGHLYAQDGSALLQRLQQTYAQARTLRADFTQTMSSPYGDDTFTGSLAVSGRQYRVDAGPQQFVTDGTTTWLYNQTQNQVIINDFVEDETTFSPTGFLTRYGSRYRVAQVSPSTQGGSKYYTLTLVPKSDDEFFEQVQVTMRDAGNVVTRLELRDVNGTTIRYDLRNVQFNAQVAASTFRFTPPSGAEVIDLREE